MDEFVPITVDVYLMGMRVAAIQCEDVSIPDSRGIKIVKVVFKEMCMDPVVIINKLLTVNLTLELEVKLTKDERRCNTVTIGPQSECMPNVL